MNPKTPRLHEFDSAFWDGTTKKQSTSILRLSWWVHLCRSATENFVHEREK